MLFIIFLLLIFIFIAVFLFIYFINKNRLLSAFKRSNVIVYGKKGTGKDLLFQYVIKARKKSYYSNISYGYRYNNIDIKDISLSPNTYNNLINNDIIKINKDYKKEKIDIYLSEAGLIFPSTYDSTLSKTYPSFPLYYALTRHLYNSNIHINTQNLNRVWIKLREQADYYVKCVRTYNLGLFFIINFIEYDKYESALSNLLPIKKSLFNKYSKAEVNLYNATHGFIKKSFVVIPRWCIKYDTRAFEKIFFDAPPFP